MLFTVVLEEGQQLPTPIPSPVEIPLEEASLEGTTEQKKRGTKLLQHMGEL